MPVFDRIGQLVRSGPVQLPNRLLSRLLECITHPPRTTELGNNWALDPRWSGIRRPYTAQDVDRLRGTIHVEHTLAAMGAKRLWKLLLEEPFVPALGALT